MSKKKKGVKTNLNVIKDYIKRLMNYIISKNNNIIGAQSSILINLNKPMGPTAI